MGPDSTGARPFVTVILPVRNEARSIARSLVAVLDQDYPAALLDVIVADGMSGDGTRDIVLKIAAKHPNLRLIDNPGRIVPTGLNCAIRQARGEIIIRVDGHTIVERDYVVRCVDALRRAGADNVGGAMRARGEGPFGRAVAAATSSRFGVGGARFHYAQGEEWVDTVYMGAWRRETFDRIGLFDEEMVRDQDDELNYRLLDRGGRILLCPEIRSSYTVRGTPLSLWRQYLQYGYWKVRVMQKHPRQIRVRQLVPPALVAGLIGSAAAACAAPGAVLVWGAIPGLYACATLTASIAAARRAGWPALLLLPMTFGILHTAYGLGFLAGLVRFAPRWRDSRARRADRLAGEDVRS